uniref:Uncharacterized protein n=1 Tax=Avena sativa TaxID=4498 RepID=A0ACD5WPS8_AVESA
MESSLLVRGLTVRRGVPVLVSPAAPTPRETKPLSDIDDAEGMRFYSSAIHLYHGDSSKQGVNPATVIREALARALVPYYPLAGRLREEAGRKLVVKCEAQGVLFVDADADITAAELGDVQCPPFPCFEHFILESTTNAGSEPVINRPLIYMQVTRLKCGGFILGQRVCHCVADAPGAMQFEKLICDLARGGRGATLPPLVVPAWGRELFMARRPPQPSYPHLEYSEPAGGPADRMLMTTQQASGDDMLVPCRFFFGPCEIAELRQRAPPHMRGGCSQFELMAAYIWLGRTAALGYGATEEVRLSFTVNARGRADVPLPVGFYGNAFAHSVAATTAGELCAGGLGYALELVKKAKSSLTYDYLLSVADLMVLRGRPLFTLLRTFIVSDVRHVGFNTLDFGWGQAIFAGPAKCGEGPFPGVTTYFSMSKNGKGEEGTAVPICLPKDAMEKFKLHLQGLTARNI